MRSEYIPKLAYPVVKSPTS